MNTVEVYNGADFKVVQNDIWATQKDMAQAFGVNVPAVNKHIQNILQDGELQADRCISKMEMLLSDGRMFKTNHYNLDMIIAVGFRVKSAIGTKFRIWANGILKKYATTGVVVNPLTVADMKKSELFRMLADAEEQKERLMLESMEKDRMMEEQEQKIQEYGLGCAKFCPVTEQPEGTRPRRGSWVHYKKRQRNEVKLF